MEVSEEITNPIPRNHSFKPDWAAIPADDIDIWEFAKRLSFVILTFDEDYINLSLRFGHPPKVILLKSFDQTSNTVMRLLHSSEKEIEEFFTSTEDSLLQIVSS